MHPACWRSRDSSHSSKTSLSASPCHMIIPGQHAPYVLTTCPAGLHVFNMHVQRTPVYYNVL
ncbi:hypothetical protein HN51_059773, partial [Arachis hypogaea]